MNATTATAFLIGLSPLLLAAIRRCSWSEETMILLAALMVVVLYTTGQYFDGVLTWPLSANFWGGLATCWVAQQASYKLLKPRVLPPLEKLGNDSATKSG